jgi:Winged helix DNA-binding domain
VQRYLAAFGPASVMDVQAWSGLTRLQEVVDRLRPELVHLRDEDGRELFDLPDAPRADPETPAPARFLPEYDNVQFGHADRRRILPDRTPPLFPGNGANAGTLLVDGWVAGEWRIARDGPRGGGGGSVSLAVVPWRRLDVRAEDDLVREGAALLTFVAPDADAHDVRVDRASGTPAAR